MFAMHNLRKFLHSNSMKTHVCAIEDRTLQREYILKDLPWYKRLSDSFKDSIRITPKNPRSHLYYRTNTAISHEREKHIKSDFAHIIHPFSSFRMYWEVFMMVIFLMYLLVVPIIVAFFQANQNNIFLANFSYVEGIFDFICIADIIMTFFTGYTIEHTKQVILNPRNISAHYLLSSYFILDVLSSMPTEFFVLIIKNSPKYSKFHEVIKFVYLVSLLKIIRTRTMLIYMNRAAELFHINEIIVNTIKYCFISFLIIHWCGCIEYIVPSYYYGQKIPNNSWIVARDVYTNASVFKKYVECLFKASSQLFCVANRIYVAETNDDIVMEIIVGFVGYVVAGLAMGKYAYLALCYALPLQRASRKIVMFLQFLFRIHTSEIKYHSIMNQLKQYMRHKQLPIPMQKRLIDYYEYRFRGTYFRENTIFPTISDRLRKDMNIYVCMNLMRKVPLLKDLPSSISANIVPCLRQEVFLPNDIIVKAGTVGDCMYFIHCGTVAVYTPTGKEVCHLQDGGYFGEMGLIAKDSKRIANVVAIETTEVYRMDRKYFNNYLKTLPDLYKKLERIAERRRENTLVMEEIHRKHILEKTMRMMDDN